LHPVRNNCFQHSHHLRLWCRHGTRSPVQPALHRLQSPEEFCHFQVRTFRVDEAQSILIASTSGTAVTSQTVMWGLTIYKKHTADREGWSDVPLMRRIVRDDTVIFISGVGTPSSLTLFMDLPHTFGILILFKRIMKPSLSQSNLPHGRWPSPRTSCTCTPAIVGVLSIHTKALC
jgi:hypothetical protein